MKISVIIPVFNEEKNITKVIEEVDKVQVSKEIIVVDDASTDASAARVEEVHKTNLQLVRHERNQGKGAAIRTGIKQATGDIILIQDADFEYNPQDYHRLIKPILENGALVVYGSRFKGKITSMAWPNLVANKVLTITANLLYRTGISDEATCYKVFKAEILKRQKLHCNRFDFCPEITAKLAKQGVKIIEVPINYQGRSRQEGKKINWKDGFVALWTLLKYRFVD